MARLGAKEVDKKEALRNVQNLVGSATKDLKQGSLFSFVQEPISH
jgi:hypothetical protein